MSRSTFQLDEEVYFESPPQAPMPRRSSLPDIETIEIARESIRRSPRLGMSKSKSSRNFEKLVANDHQIEHKGGKEYVQLNDNDSSVFIQENVTSKIF